jgi:hypothetical protein
MNICVVSTFEGNIEDYMSLMAEFEEEMKEAGDSFDIGVVDTGVEGVSGFFHFLFELSHQRHVVFYIPFKS